jgi:hypothetical protein
MTTFDIPYVQVHPGVWSVKAGEFDFPRFKSRVDALRFAITAALKSEQEGRTALIAIEGVDGQWRMFDYLEKGVV